MMPCEVTEWHRNGVWADLIGINNVAAVEIHPSSRKPSLLILSPWIFSLQKAIWPGGWEHGFGLG